MYILIKIMYILTLHITKLFNILNLYFYIDMCKICNLSICKLFIRFFLILKIKLLKGFKIISI